jgi:hypothetical protein
MEVERLKELEEKVMEEERLNDPANKWWKKPAGIIAIVLISAVIVVVVAVIGVRSMSR